MEDAKKTLRRRMLAAREALGPDEVKAASLAVAHLVRGLERWRSASEVLAYWPARNELDPRPLVVDLWTRGARVLLPRCRPGEPGLMDLACVTGEAQLAAGAFSLMEPAPSCPIELDARPHVVLVPGLAFDGRGNRLGFGGGYYDRLLAGPAFASSLKLGLCYGFQRVESLPAGPFDQPVDAVCCEEGITWTR